MKRLKSFKYLFVLTMPVLVYISFTSTGILTFLPIIEAFILIPVLELFMDPDKANPDETTEAFLKEDKLYDYMLYIIVPLQFVFLYLFLESFKEEGLTAVDKIGRISSMGLMCGVLGINVAHELGHRSTWYEQLMAKMLLLTSIYMHFFIEHNRGHHKNVSTKEDPSSARKGENVYAFWIRSVVFAYLSAWKLEAKRLNKKGLPVFTFRNEMIVFQLVQVFFLSVIFLFWGFQTGIYFLAAAVIGFLLLETVNYIEHYGLERSKTEKGNYERVMPHHSWNSDHVMGRLFLFELSRHSDHHFIASRKYQILRHIDKSPQMPTGYPGMILLALVPPLWFNVMDRRLEKEMKMIYN
jgi:alkane 1-monooxygenase